MSERADFTQTFNSNDSKLVTSHESASDVILVLYRTYKKTTVETPTIKYAT